MEGMLDILQIFDLLFADFLSMVEAGLLLSQLLGEWT